MDPERAKDIRARIKERKEQRRKTRAKGFVTKRRRQNLKEWVTFQRQRFNFEETRKKKMQERDKAIKERCGPNKSPNSMGEEEVVRLCKLYQNHVARLEEDLYDIDYDVRFKDMKINELRLELDEMRGRFVKPELKKVRRFLR